MWAPSLAIQDVRRLSFLYGSSGFLERVLGEHDDVAWSFDVSALEGRHCPLCPPPWVEVAINLLSFKGTDITLPSEGEALRICGHVSK